jgi:hypothetical protein
MNLEKKKNNINEEMLAVESGSKSFFGIYTCD